MRKCTVLVLAVFVFFLSSCGRKTPAAQTQLPVTEAPTSSMQTQTSATQTKPSVTETQPSATTTQPPVTTTQPPENTMAAEFEPQPPEDGSVLFTATDVRIYRDYERDFEPTAVVADSRKALNDTLRSVSDAYRPNNVKQESAAAYTDEWFETHRLIVIAVQESSGSYRHDVRKVTYTENGVCVKIERWHPHVCTCDVAHWLIFIELSDTHLQNGDSVDLVWGADKT